jgi:NADH-quinone oxidoreductase subunit N
LLKSQLHDILTSLGGFGPVAGLMIAFCGLLIAELLLVRGLGLTRARGWLAALTLLAVLGAGAWAVMLPTRGFLFMHLLFLDNQAVFMQVIVALGAVLVVVYESNNRIVGQPNSRTVGLSNGQLPNEWYALLLAVVAGLFLLAESVNLLAIYLALELVSIGSYLLTALPGTRRSVEGGIKYLLFGAISSAVMLYGMSLLYGLTGTLDLTAEAFGQELAHQDALVVIIAGLLTLAGLFFKLSLVPFHVWTPDTYDAAPLPVAAFFSVAPKAVALLVIMRIVTALPETTLPNPLQVPLAVLALASILLGNLAALWQTDAKRMLAYSTIAHAGFLLVGVVSMTESGFEAASFYVATYLIINLSAFFLIDRLAVRNGGSLLMTDFAGLGARYPVLATALTVAMLALVGLPPTVGFTAKLLVFSALYETATADAGITSGWLLALFGIGLLNAVISLAYYLKIPFLLFFRPRPETLAPLASMPMRFADWLAVALAVLTVLLFLQPDWLLHILAGF